MQCFTSLSGSIAFLSVFFIFTPIIIITRQWIIRRQPSSTASKLTATAVWLFLLIFVAASGILVSERVEEQRVRRVLPEAEESVIQHVLMTDSSLKRFFVTSILYTTMLYLLKAAFLGYFWNLRYVLSPRSWRLFLGVCVYTFLAYIVTVLFQLFTCMPIPRNWSLDPSRQCVHFQTLVVTSLQGGLNLSADLLVLAMALVIISNMRLTRSGRLALWFVAAVGSVSIVMCVVRFVQIYRLVAMPDPAVPRLLVMRQVMIWAALEVNFAAAAFCLPAFRVVGKKWWGGEKMVRERDASRERSEDVVDWDSWVVDEELKEMPWAIRSEERLDVNI